MKRILEAANYAANKHAQQRRKGIEATPYINHPLEVAHLLISVGEVYNENILVAALLHDIIEDTETQPEELAQQFGREVLAYILEVTDDKSLPKQERKRLQIANAPALSEGAKLIKLADKISNVRAVICTPPQEWPVSQQHEYVEWASVVCEGLGNINLQLQLLFAKESYRALKVIQKRYALL